MSMFKIDSEHFGGEVKVISPTQVFSDIRGFFSVEFRKDDFKKLGLPYEFVQDNISRSAKGVVRGLHFQMTPPMGKLMHVTAGRAYLVTVDLRKGPTFLKWLGIEASSSNRVQVWAPSSFARGYCSLEDNTDVHYKCTEYFDADGDAGIYWNDPDIGVDWPVKNPILSERDRLSKTVREGGL
jgi:dTDP-4-dehydrorhamnose 3,5-epimerase